MGGNGTFGGGGKSCQINFTVWEEQGKKRINKQKWTGTDPHVATGRSDPCWVTVTFHKPPQQVGNKAFKVRVNKSDGKVVGVRWK